VPIPFSIRPNEYISNLKAAIVDPLTDGDMQEIAGIDKNNRLIKGQVFLWETAKDWPDLWDLDGKIAAA
jgi:alcohol dehydrogenase (NADP+)